MDITLPGPWATHTERLREADLAMAEQLGAPARSLDPSRAHATSLSKLCDMLAPRAEDPEVVDAFVTGLIEISRSQLEHFPETLFWDIDFMASSLLEGSRTRDARELASLCDKITKIQARYGHGSIIAFRYTHDFSYGFDWAKWVLKDPTNRQHVGPFDEHFIDYLLVRADELADLIANDDVKYPKLPDGTPRNPFGFSREPEDELRLFASLAEHQLVPVESWSVDTTPRWREEFAELREQHARNLGIATRSTAKKHSSAS